MNAQGSIHGRKSRVPSAFGLALLVCLVAGPVPAQQEDEPGKETRVVKLTETEEAADKNRTTVLLTIVAQDRPLKQVLDYIYSQTGINVKALEEKTEQLPVTLDLHNVSCRAALDFIAKKYGLVVDETRMQEKLVILSMPPRIFIDMQRADIRTVIDTIAKQAKANVVVGPEVQGEITMTLENVPWTDALNIAVKTLDFVAVPEANDTLRITTPDKLQRQLETRIFKLAYLSPEGAKFTATISSEFVRRDESKEQQDTGTTLIDVLARMKGPEGKVAYIKRGQALIVTDTSTKLDSMQSIIGKLDVAPKQIHVSVKIVAMNDDDSERLGVNWGSGLQFQLQPLSLWPTAFPFDASHGLTSSLLGRLAIGVGRGRSFNNAAVTSNVYPLREASHNVGISPSNTNPWWTSVFTAPSAINLGSMGFGSTSLLFEMIRTKTSSRIIQSPELMALDNEEATIQVGQLIRYAESFVATTDGGGQVSGYREAAGSPIKEGLQLLIAPHVTGPENNILLTVIPKTEELIAFRDFTGPNGLVLSLPQTRQRIVVTKMLLRNGETGVIGGLRIDRDTRAQNHVPVFSEIPILGRLFKHRTRSVVGENLMIFVTPTIVDMEQKEDFRQQLDKLRQQVSRGFAPLGEESGAGPR